MCVVQGFWRSEVHSLLLHRGFTPLLQHGNAAVMGNSLPGRNARASSNRKSYSRIKYTDFFFSLSILENIVGLNNFFES